MNDMNRNMETNEMKNLLPQQQTQQQQKCCNHDHQHNHHQHHQHHQHHNHSIQINPFKNIPKQMWVFALYSVCNGDFMLQIFLQLPMMGQFYYLTQMAKQTVLMPFYQINMWFNQVIKNKILKQILGSFALFYFIVHSFLLYLNYETYPEFQTILYICYALLIVYLLFLIFPIGHFNSQEFEELIKQKPEVIQLSNRNRNVCVLCKIPKVIRSQHCLYCQKCVKRWEAHSMQLNTCIGIYNYPLFLLYMTTWVIYFIFVIRQYIIPEREQQKTFFDLLIILINLDQLYYFGQQLLLCIIRISFNITPHELSQWRRMAYFWGDERGTFFNPFNKGIIYNWIQFFKPLFTNKGDENWATNKYLNVADIPGHPMKEKCQQAVDQQIQMMRKMEREFIRQQTAQDETQGLLEP